MGTILTGNFAARLADSLVDLVEEHHVLGLLLIVELFLVAGFHRILEEDTAFDAVMEHELVHEVLRLEASLLPRELSQVVWRLRVG